MMELCDCMNERGEQCVIEESTFLFNLSNYLKKKRFCPTCKENIQFSYQTLKESACEDECLSDCDEAIYEKHVIQTITLVIP